MIRKLPAAIIAMLITTATAYAHAIHVDPSAFTGNWSLGSHTGPGADTVDLPSGTYAVWILGWDYFYFSIDASGFVTVPDGTSNGRPDNMVAATGGDHSLTFNTVEISIQPGSYTGPYSISSQPGVTRPTAATLVRGVNFYIESGCSFAGTIGTAQYASYFSVYVGANGIVGSRTPTAATGDGLTITLANSQLTIDPLQYTGDYKIVGSTITGLRQVTVIPGLGFCFDNGSAVGGSAGQSYFIFGVRADGNAELPITPAAHAVGNTITLGNVRMRIDPGSYTGSYNVGTYRWLSGVTERIYIPGLLVGLSAGNNTSYFFPAPPATTLSVNGNQKTFVPTVSCP